MITTTIKRNETADLLKGLAVFFMIQVHIMEQFASQNVYNSYFGKLSLFIGGPACAPVFLAVMGYFLVSSSKPVWYYLKRGFLLFLGGILLNILRSFHLIFHIIGGKFLLSSNFFIFGVDILTLAGLSIMFVGIMQLIFKKNILGYLISAILIAFVSPYLPLFGTDNSALQHANAFLWGNYAWSYFPLFPWFAYVLLGYSFKLFTSKYPHLINLKKPSQYLIIVAILMFLALTIKYGVNTAYDLHGKLGYYHHGILFFVWAMFFLISYLCFINIIEKFLGNNFVFKFIKWIGRNVTFVYVVQWIIIGNIATVIYKTQNIYQYFIWFIIVTIATAILTYIWSIFIDYYNKRNEDLI